MGESGDVRRWLVPAVILIALLMFLSLGRCSGDNSIVGAVRGGGGPAQTQGVAPPNGAPTGAGSGSGSGSGTGSGTGSGSREITADSGTVAASNGMVLPLAFGVGVGGNLDRFAGHRAVGKDVLVQSVVADEGFWIGTSDHDRIWVQLTGPPPESPYTVRKGDRVSFDAEVVTNGRGFARKVGCDRSEGSEMLTDQGQHLDVRKTKLKPYT
jgi:hypothetical protein